MSSVCQLVRTVVELGGEQRRKKTDGGSVRGSWIRASPPFELQYNSTPRASTSKRLLDYEYGSNKETTIILGPSRILMLPTSLLYFEHSLRTSTLLESSLLYSTTVLLLFTD